MPKLLTPDQVGHYRDYGYVSPLRAFPEEEARACRTELENGERTHGLPADRRRKMHLYLTWVDTIVRHARVLDAVEDLIGPDILLYHLTLWLKEPRTDAFISWHQDSTYFGLSPAEHVTAWVALSPSNLESGCVQVVPGSHLAGQAAHGQEQNAANMFATGQNLAVAADAPLEMLVLVPGEFSLHHTHLFHNSMPNRSDDRRIGLAIRYIPTHVKQAVGTRDWATLVRGVDTHKNFLAEHRPVRDLSADALAFHKMVSEEQVKVLYRGTGKQEYRA